MCVCVYVYIPVWSPVHKQLWRPFKVLRSEVSISQNLEQPCSLREAEAAMFEEEEGLEGEEDDMEELWVP